MVAVWIQDFFRMRKRHRLFILTELNEITPAKAKPTTNTTRKCDMLMDYLHTNPDAVIPYQTSNILLKVVSDVAFSF